MDFKAKVKALAEKIETTKEQITTEEGTKNAFVMPFIQALGFDVFNHADVVPEFIADVGMKKGEKVDYALCVGGKPSVLIEAKKWRDKLDKHGTQLTRYFTFSVAKFGILTNGIKYWFFTDLDKANIMDAVPFFCFDLTDCTDEEIELIERFSKDKYDQKAILEAAMQLVYSREIRALVLSELTTPTKDFVKYVAEKTYLEKQRGRLTDKVLTLYGDLLRQYLPRIKDEIAAEKLIKKSAEAAAEQTSEEARKIVTTEEELEAFFIVKAICRHKVASSRIAYRDAQTYFAILLDDNRLKTICRVYLNGGKKFLAVFDANRAETKIEIAGVDDIFDHADKLFATLRLLDKSIAD